MSISHYWLNISVCFVLLYSLIKHGNFQLRGIGLSHSTAPYPILVMPRTRLRSAKYKLLSHWHWFDSAVVWTPKFLYQSLHECTFWILSPFRTPYGQSDRARKVFQGRWLFIIHLYPTDSSLLSIMIIWLSAILDHGASRPVSQSDMNVPCTMSVLILI